MFRKIASLRDTFQVKVPTGTSTIFFHANCWREFCRKTNGLWEPWRCEWWPDFVALVKFFVAHKSPQTWLVRWRNFENSWFNKTHNGFVLPKGLNGQCLFQSLSRLWESTCHHPNLQHEGLESGSAGNQRDSRHKSWKYVGSSWKIEATGSLDHCQLLDFQKIWIDSKFEWNFCQETTAKLDHITGLSGSYSKPRSLTQQLWEWQEKQPSPSKVKYLEPRNVYMFVNALVCMCPDLHPT